MAKFFTFFPTVAYDIEGKQLTNYQNITNIFFRVKMIREVLSNSATYYEHLVRDEDTPEILADKVYGDPEAHWIILMANDIVDPQSEWPLNYKNFKNYLVKKYRSRAEADRGTTLSDNQVIAWTQDTTNANSYHHFEKVVKRENSLAGVVTESRFVVNRTKLAQNVNSIIQNLVYDYYEEPTEPPTYGNYGDVLARESTYVPINSSIFKLSSNTTTTNPTATGIQSSQTIIENIYGEGITYYDYENSVNETKRPIKIIKPEYYGQIIKEFKEYTGYSDAPFRRRLRV